VDTTSSSSQTTLSRETIAATPGATRANSLDLITDYTPGAYMVHDQLHVRGGHQVSWLVDGIPVPNTNIAANVGPQFDPKDMDVVEIQRGGYSADYGDRIYGVFNVIPRSGFERDREIELLATYGNFHSTDSQISIGDHTDRFAYYASVSANRSDIGLMPPEPNALHDNNNGVSGFTSLIFNATPNDQLRLAVSARADFFQVPNTTDQQDAQIRDTQRERDGFLNFSWVHTFGPGL
jgi:outer membrane cobalamin receptor